MKNQLVEKLKEVMRAVLPVSGVIFLLHLTLTPMPKGVLLMFLSSVPLLILGMALFTLGADVGMTPIGNQIGAKLTEKRSIPLLVISALLMGIMITVAEPDLQVLSKQMPPVTLFSLGEFEATMGGVLIIAVAIGVGLFLVGSLLRIVFQWDLGKMLIGLYLLVFALAIFTGKDYLAVAFDSGGVTTGPITVPFILALGVGVASVRGGNSSRDDSFGLVALCSVGPVLTVLILGMLAKGEGGYESYVFPNVENLSDLLNAYADALPHYAKEVGLALLPIMLFYGFAQVLFIKAGMRTVTKTLVGVAYTYIGLVIFLTSVNVGFMPAGSFIGGAIASLSFKWVLIPIGMLVGYFIVAAEPAVHVLNEQVEEVSDGAISRQAIMNALSIGMSVSVGLAMTRVLTGISIWYMLIPGYFLALGLTFFVPKIFTAVAFDSGGVASGPMTATFLLPFATGACLAFGGNVMADAFGVVAMVAMTPLVTIQTLGLVYAIKEKKAKAIPALATDINTNSATEEEDIIDF